MEFEWFYSHQKMIQSLIETIKDNLVRVSPDLSEADISYRPILPFSPTPPPIIAIYPGKLRFRKNDRELSEGRPRLHKVRQTIKVKTSKPEENYRLNHTPLKGTLQAKLLSDKESDKERELEPIDPIIITCVNKTIEISSKETLDFPGTIYLDYAFVGVLRNKEFQQELFVDFYDTDIARLEKLNALVTGIVLTNYIDLMETSNEEAKRRSPPDLLSVMPRYEGIEPLEAIPDIQENMCRLRLKLQVTGTLKIIREIVDGLGVVKSIKSPGQVAEKEGFRIRIHENHHKKWTKIYSEAKTPGASEVLPKATKS
jgi:hypothetical protein